MKVLYLINYAGNGGSERYVELLLRACHPERRQCGLCCNEEGPLAEKARALGVPVFQLSMKSPFDLAAAKKLAKLCREEGFDVIHAQYPRENYIAILSRLFGSRARVVFTAHLTLEQPLPWRLLNRIMTPHDHKIIALCEEGAAVLAKNGVNRKRTTIIYNGVDASTMPPRDRSVLAGFGIGEDELVLTILARFAPEKGLPFLCRTVARLKEKTKVPFRVLIAGQGEQMEEIRQLIQSLGLAGTVLLPGFRTDSDRLLAASDIYLCSSAYNEAMSYAILEAMANRLPVAATDVGGNRTLVELDGQAGFIVPYGDEEGFSDAIQALLEDAGLRRRLGEAAWQKTQGVFSLGYILDRTFETYQ